MIKLAKWWVSGVLGLAVFAPVARAQAGGFELGARLGYGIPMGKAVDDPDGALSTGIKGMIPLQLDLGYRVIPNLTVGGYVMYGFGLNGDDTQATCDLAQASGADASCSTSDVRLGIQAHYHIAPTKKTDPWVGAGFGYEWLSLGFDASLGGTSVKATSTTKGFEFLNLQGGVDFRAAPGFGIGPFLSFSLAQFGSFGGSCSGACTGITIANGDITNKALHQWLLLGVRGSFLIGGSGDAEEE
jgi:outer membrane protein W